MMASYRQTKIKAAGCKDGCRLQIPERGGRATGLFQSLCTASRLSQSCSKGRSEGSIAKMNRLVEIGLRAKSK
jgi:hypothetical protein